MLYPHFTTGAPHEEIIAGVFAWAQNIFVYVPDDIARGVPDHWPSPAELEANFAEHNGEVHDDCDGFACLCREALRRNDIRSRLVLCWVEAAADREYHAVCEADGWVLDNRQRAVVRTQDLEATGYIWDRMSGFETGDPWTAVKREET